MGKLIAQITNEDPERLKRVLDAKWRTIGVSVCSNAWQQARCENRLARIADIGMQP